MTSQGTPDPLGLPASHHHRISDDSSGDKTLRRKEAHKEVEHRRKLRITSCIQQLSQLLEPSCHCARETSAEVLERVIERVRELEHQNSQLSEKNKIPAVSEELLQKQLAELAVEHITMMVAIAEHLQQQNSDPPPPPPLPQKLTFGIAELLPDSTLPHSPPPQHQGLSPPLPLFQQQTPSASSPLQHSKDQPSCSVWRPYSIQHQDNPPPPPLPPNYPSSSFLVGNLLDHM